MRVNLAYLEENADAEIHERFREVDHTLPGIVYRHRPNGQVRLLQFKWGN